MLMCSLYLTLLKEKIPCNTAFYLRSHLTFCSNDLPPNIMNKQLSKAYALQTGLGEMWSKRDQFKTNDPGVKKRREEVGEIKAKTISDS